MTEPQEQPKAAPEAPVAPPVPAAPAAPDQGPEEAAPAPAAEEKGELVLQKGTWCWVAVKSQWKKGQISKVVGGNVMILVEGAFVSKLRAHLHLCHRDDEKPPQQEQ